MTRFTDSPYEPMMTRRPEGGKAASRPPSLSPSHPYLKEEAPMDEQSFPMVMEMLNYAEGAKEDGDKDVIDILMEETAARTRQREEYFSDYRRYQLMQVDKARVLLACRVIINDLLGKLYRYDYNVGYDCLLDDGNSISRKLKKSNEEMEVEEDAPCDR